MPISSLECIFLQWPPYICTLDIHFCSISSYDSFTNASHEDGEQSQWCFFRNATLALTLCIFESFTMERFFFFFYYNTPVGISYAGVKLKAFSLENEEIGYSVPTPSLHARLTLRLNIPLCFPYMSRRIFNKELGECLADPGPVQSAFCPKAVSDPTRHCWIKTKEHFLNTNILYRRSFSSVH